jgi:hypothetical protein
MMSVFVFSILLFCFAPRLFNFLLLLFDQEALHGIVVIMILHQKREFSLF